MTVAGAARTLSFLVPLSARLWVVGDPVCDVREVASRRAFHRSGPMSTEIALTRFYMRASF